MKSTYAVQPVRKTTRANHQIAETAALPQAFRLVSCPSVQTFVIWMLSSRSARHPMGSLVPDLPCLLLATSGRRLPLRRVRLTGASDVGEVLAWAEGRAEGRAFAVYVLVDALGEVGLVQLAGLDPTASP
jgi:hypothetical protein